MARPPPRLQRAFKGRLADRKTPLRWSELGQTPAAHSLHLADQLPKRAKSQHEEPTPGGLPKSAAPSEPLELHRDGLQ